MHGDPIPLYRIWGSHSLVHTFIIDSRVYAFMHYPDESVNFETLIFMVANFINKIMGIVLTGLMGS